MLAWILQSYIVCCQPPSKHKTEVVTLVRVYSDVFKIRINVVDTYLLANKSTAGEVNVYMTAFGLTLALQCSAAHKVSENMLLPPSDGPPVLQLPTGNGNSRLQNMSHYSEVHLNPPQTSNLLSSDFGNHNKSNKYIYGYPLYVCKTPEFCLRGVLIWQRF